MTTRILPLTPIESSVIGAALHIPDEPWVVVQQIYRINEGGRFNWSQSDYQEALESCLTDGLLAIADEFICTQDLISRALEDIPSCSIRSYCVGHLAITPIGAELYRMANREFRTKTTLSGTDRSRPEVLSVYAETKTKCLEAIDESLECLRLNHEKARIISITLPEAIGAWRQSRIWVCTKGFRVKVIYSDFGEGPYWA